MAYEIIWLEQTVIVKYMEHTTIADMEEVTQLIHNDERLPQIRKKICNAMEVTNTDILSYDMRIFAQMDLDSLSTNDNFCTAIVATSPAVVELANTYINAMSDSSPPVKIFSTVKEALEWQPDSVLG